MALVSVIIPTYNRAVFVLKAIESVLAQTFTDYEIIVVDDGSTDNTDQQVANLVKSNEKVRYYKIVNQGVSFARNFGVDQSRGEWLAFLDSDDQWLPKKLEKQVLEVTNNNFIDIIYTDEKWIRNGKFVNKKKYQGKYSGDIFKECLASCFIGPSTVMMRRSLLDKYSRFNISYPVCEDYDLWLKISLHHEVYLVDEPLVEKHGGHDDQLSTRFFAMDFWRIRSICDLLDDFKIPREKKKWALESLIEKSNILLAGYEKHGRFEEADELKKMIELKIKGP